MSVLSMTLALIYIYTLKGEITENGETRSVDKKGTITILK